jgi:hypothetical protein
MWQRAFADIATHDVYFIYSARRAMLPLPVLRRFICYQIAGILARREMREWLRRRARQFEAAMSCRADFADLPAEQDDAMTFPRFRARAPQMRCFNAEADAPRAFRYSITCHLYRDATPGRALTHRWPYTERQRQRRASSFSPSHARRFTLTRVDGRIAPFEICRTACYFAD